MDLQGFINKYNGIAGVGDTPENKGQCVGLIEVWTDSLGLPHTWGNAKDLLANADTAKFDVVHNSPDNSPVPGDIVCWNWGTYGHTGVVVSADKNSLTVFEQNNPAGHPPQIVHHNDYSGVIGWLHPKTVIQMVSVDAGKFSELVDKSSKYDLFNAAGYATIDDVTKKVGEVNATNQNYQKDIQTLSQQLSDQAAIVQKVKDQDITFGNETIDAQHQRDEAQGKLETLIKALKATSYDQAIINASQQEKQHAEVVKQVQPVMDKLAEAAIYVKPPVKKPNVIKRFITWMNT